MDLGIREIKLYYILVGHILNPLWKSREERRKKRYKAIRESVLWYLRRYIPFIKDFQPESIINSVQDEKVFTIWFQGEENAPALVKACFRSMRRHLTQELIILDEKTIFDWISLPDYIVDKWRKGKIKPAHFSDICRVELLYQHGGFWLDSTDYITSSIPSYILDSDFFMFLAGEHVGGWYSYVQNCFIRARKGNQLLGIWRHAIFTYWKHENSEIDYFVHQLLYKLCIDNNNLAKLLHEKMPHVNQDETHSMWYSHYKEIYSPERFKELTEGSFFQKTTFKVKDFDKLSDDSIGAYVINS